MNVGVAGLGFMGSTHLQAIAKIPGVRLLAVADRDEKRLSGDLSGIEGNLGIPGAKLDFTGVRKYREFDQMLADGEINAVDLCLPTNWHAPLAIAALRAGKHVFVEKPMALDGESAGAMIAAADQSGRILMVGQVLRFLPAYQRLSELVKSGRLGTIRSAMFRRRTAVPTWGPWEFDKSKSGGGVFDLLIHDVDMCLHLFGVPEAVSSTGHENMKGGVDMITSQLHYPGADSVTVTGGWHHTGKYPFSMEFTVVADNGVVEFSSAGRPPQVYWSDGGTEVLENPAVDPYQAELEYFFACAKEGRRPELCPPEESAAAVQVAKLMVEAREEKGAMVKCRLSSLTKSA